MRLGTSGSRVMSGRNTPRGQSSMNIRGDGGNARNNNADFFITQTGEGIGSGAPRTGGAPTRNGLFRPLMTEGHQRMTSMNNS